MSGLFRVISGLFSIPMPSFNRAPGKALRVADEAAPRYVVGPENALAAELVRVALADWPPYNPLVIYGTSGVGKTTLAHLLADQRQQARGLASVVRTTAADLARGLAHAAETNSVVDLRVQHHRCDLLLMDDVHELADRPAAQQFLVATLDVLIRRGVLVIATLRQLPSETDSLLPTLASRLSGGLVVPLLPPAALARQEIANQLAAQLELRLTDRELVQLTGDQRRRGPATAAQLRHAIMQLAAARQNGSDSPLVQDTDAKAVFRQAAALVAKHFQVTLGEIKGKSRRQHVVEARSTAMYLCRELTDASFAEIGRHFGNRDHTTVLHACRKTKDLIGRDPVARRMLSDLTIQITTEPLRT